MSGNLVRVMRHSVVMSAVYRHTLNRDCLASTIPVLNACLKQAAVAFSTSPVQCKRQDVRTLERRSNYLRTFEKQQQSKEDKVYFTVWHGITVQELAPIVRLSVDELFELILYMPESVQVVDDVTPIWQAETFKQLAKLLRCNFKFMQHNTQQDVEKGAKFEQSLLIPVDPSLVRPRPPIVVIMGHVDHGKTTLLDFLRNSNTRIVDSEFGGITQHVGAFTVDVGNQFASADDEVVECITFIDTPGHAAFSIMRNRSASMTDIALLIIDAAEGVMPQTRESIKMIRQAGNNMIVVLNKIDKEKADVERVMEELYKEEHVELERFGGDVQCVAISAANGTNIDSLIEAIVLEANSLSLTTEYGPHVQGHVVESQMKASLGATATVLVTRGSIEIGSFLVAGSSYAKVKKISTTDGNNRKVKSVGPSRAASICGWKSLPTVGEVVRGAQTEKRAKQMAAHFKDKENDERQKVEWEKIEQRRRANQVRHTESRRQRLVTDLDNAIKGLKRSPTSRDKESVDLGSGSCGSGITKIAHIIKADVQGSLEAIQHCLGGFAVAKEEGNVHPLEQDVELDEVGVGVGLITVNDLELAKAFNATVYAFNLPITQKVYQLAAQMNVEIRPINVIFELIDDVQNRITSVLPQHRADIILGRASVQAVYSISVKRKSVPVAGCRVVSGLIDSKASVRVVRSSIIVADLDAQSASTSTLHDGKIRELRHLKRVVDSVDEGTECGIMFDVDTIDLKAGDEVVSYVENYENTRSEWNPGF